MPKMLFIRLHAPNGEEEAIATAYGRDGEELPVGVWSVRHVIQDSDEQPEIMTQFEMPQHWREQLVKWGQWAEKNLDL